jgi:hypothetical protein
LTTVALRNDFTPGQIVNERRFCNFLQVAASTFGVAFVAETKEGCTDASEAPRVGVFLKPNGAPLEKVALQGEPAGPYPNSPGGTNYTAFVGPIAINNAGTVAFQARAGAPTLTGLNVLFLCEQASSCPSSSLPEGAVTTGQADGNNNILQALSSPGLSAAGDMSFSAKVGPVGKRPFTGVYVYRRATETIETIVLKGDAVPNQAGRIFESFPTDPSPTMSSAGKVAFKAKIKGTAPGDKKQKEGIFLFE